MTWKHCPEMEKWACCRRHAYRCCRPRCRGRGAKGRPGDRSPPRQQCHRPDRCLRHRGGGPLDRCACACACACARARGCGLAAGAARVALVIAGVGAYGAGTRHFRYCSSRCRCHCSRHCPCNCPCQCDGADAGPCGVIGSLGCSCWRLPFSCNRRGTFATGSPYPT